MRKRLLFAGLVVMLAQFLTPVMGRSSPTPDFVAVLNGENQVPQRETAATGKAVFSVNHDHKRIDYKVTVNKIENVVGARIHLGKPGEDGPVIATLVGPLPPGKGPKDGTLVQGSLDAGDLQGPLWPGAEGSRVPDDVDLLFDELVSTLRSGRTYVNIQTDLGWKSANPRPGNFQEGEIRGQILPPTRK